MKSREFCYWLQGSFELNPGLDSFDPAQTKVIFNHLALVAQHEGLAGIEESSKLCQWLHSFLGAKERIAPSAPFDGAQLALLKSKLADAFRLDIDPSYGDLANHAERERAHGGRGPLPKGVEAMC